MKKLAFLLFLILTTAVAYGQTKTTVTDTLYAPDGTLASGSIQVTNPTTFTAADGSVVQTGLIATTTVTSGVFTISLIPNTGSNPTGTYYIVTYTLSGAPSSRELWIVPQSANPVNLAAVRTATVPTTNVLLNATQMPALTGDVTSTAGTVATNVVGVHFGSTALSLGTVPSDGQCLTRSGVTITGIACGSGSGSQHQVNGVNLLSNTTINLENSAATNGLTLTFANPSAGNVQLGLTGTLANSGLANSSTTLNGQTVALGASGNIPFSVNGTNNTTLTGLNAVTSTVNAVGLTVTPSNPSTNNWKFEITGSNYTGNASTATALATVPTQCTGGQFATGIAASGNANCGTPSASVPNPLSTVAIEDKGGQVFNVKSYGAKGDGKSYFDGVLGNNGVGSANSFDHTGSATVTAPAVTTTVANSIAIWAFSTNAAWTSAPARGTNRLTQPGSFGLTLNDQIIATAGSVTALSGTASASAKWATGTVFAAPTTGNSITFGEISSFSNATPGTTITVSSPVGLTVGQEIIACLSWSAGALSDNSLTAVPAGFTQIFTTSDLHYQQLTCYDAPVNSIPANYQWTQVQNYGVTAFIAAYNNIDLGSVTFQSASNPFTAGAVNDPICIAGVGVSGAQICGTIASFISSSQIGLSAAFSSATSGSSLWFNFGTNDDAAVQLALSTAQSGRGGVLYFPPGDYVLTQALQPAANNPLIIQGAGAASPNTPPNYFPDGGGFTPGPFNENTGSILQFDTTSLSTAAVSLKSPGIGLNNITANDEIKDLTLYAGAGKNRDGGGSDGIDIIAWEWASVKNVWIANFIGNGVYYDYLGNAGGDGWIVQMSLEGSYIFWNGSYGVKIGSTFTGHRLETIHLDTDQIENNGGPGLGLVGANIQGFSLTNSIVQWDNVAAANPEIQITSTSVSGCRIQSNYIETGFAGSLSNAPFTANSSGCLIGPNYLNGFTNSDGNYIASKSIRSGNSGNTDLAGQITLAAGSGSFTFTGTYSSAPICTASDTTAANPVKVATTTTALTLTGTSTDVVNYVCLGRN